MIDLTAAIPAGELETTVTMKVGGMTGSELTSVYNVVREVVGAKR